MAVAAPEKQEVRAEAKWVRVSPRKARLVAEHIRGRSVPEARTVLAFTQRAAAREIEKVLHSAVSNAETNPNLNWNGDDLVVSAAYVDEVAQSPKATAAAELQSQPKRAAAQRAGAKRTPTRKKKEATA